jgi:hypothetical protein
MSMATQQQAVKKQQRAEEEWMSYQQNARRQEMARQDQFHAEQEPMRAEAAEKFRLENQKDVQEGAQETLTKELTEDIPTDITTANAGDLLLSGQKYGGQEMQEDAASRLNQASKDARSRIAALAAAESFGDSGLGMSNKLNLTNTNQKLNLVNNMRQGSMNAYGAAQAVNPVKYSPVTNPYGDVASSLAKTAGTSWGNYFAQNPNAKA